MSGSVGRVGRSGEEGGDQETGYPSIPAITLSMPNNNINNILTIFKRHN